MPIQKFVVYTANGYAGDLVDSGPRVVQTGILVKNAAGVESAGFGLSILRQVTGKTVDRGVELGGAENVYAISQREGNHEAGTRPAKAGVDGTWAYHLGDSVSLIREGFLRIKINGILAIKAGDALHVDLSTGEFSNSTLSDTVLLCSNVFAEENGNPGDIIKTRIDIK